MMLEYDFIRNKLKKQLGREYNTKKDLVEDFIMSYDKMTVLSSLLDREGKS